MQVKDIKKGRELNLLHGDNVVKVKVEEIIMGQVVVLTGPDAVYSLSLETVANNASLVE